MTASVGRKNLWLRPAPHGGWPRPCMAVTTAVVLLCFVLVYTSVPYQAGVSLCKEHCSCTSHDALPSNTNNGTTSKECAVRLPSEAFFVVQCFDFTDTSGGITVLHFLVDRLNRLYGQLGPVAFLYGCEVTNPAWATPLLPSWRNVSKGIAVYPEVTWGNDMNSSHVIRWVLWFPGGHSGPSAAEYNPTDLIACFSPGICTQFSHDFTVRQLRLIDYGLEYLHDLPVMMNRTGTWIYHRKTRWWRQGADQPFERNYTRFRPIDGNVLPSDMSKRERMKLFATAESFYSYDAGTWRNVEAALAGAKSVVLPVEGVSKEEWLRSIYGAEELEYGVAYGEDDLPHAVATQHLLLPTLKRRALEQERELQQFVAHACRFFSLHCRMEPC